MNHRLYQKVIRTRKGGAGKKYDRGIPQDIKKLGGRRVLGDVQVTHRARKGVIGGHKSK